MTRITTAKKVLMVMAMTGATLAGSAGIASAGPGPAPGTGVIGGCNMLLDPTMMTVPMVKDTLHGNGANGNAGMFGAVAASGDPTCSSFGG
jgi:hypothetical protein